MTRPSAPTKAELHEMLAEAVRNTQPQPQPEPVPNTRPRKTRSAPKHTAKIAPKRTAKIKSARRKPRP
jgi:hypothetical protein